MNFTVGQPVLTKTDNFKDGVVRAIRPEESAVIISVPSREATGFKPHTYSGYWHSVSVVADENRSHLGGAFGGYDQDGQIQWKPEAWTGDVQAQMKTVRDFASAVRGAVMKPIQALNNFLRAPAQR